mgnify:CR=1 FL=1
MISGLKPAEPNEALVRLADRVREHFGAPVIVSSGVRCITHNALVGGAVASRHMAGKAMDFCVKGKSASEVLAFVQSQKDVRYAYAIEYDCIDPLALYPTLQVKVSLRNTEAVPELTKLLVGKLLVIRHKYQPVPNGRAISGYFQNKLDHLSAAVARLFFGACHSHSVITHRDGFKALLFVLVCVKIPVNHFLLPPFVVT